MICEKQFANATISKSAHSRGVAQAVDLDFKCLGGASVRKAFAMIHGVLGIEPKLSRGRGGGFSSAVTENST